MKYIKCMLIMLIIISLSLGTMAAIKACYDVFPTVHSTLDAVREAM